MRSAFPPGSPPRAELGCPLEEYLCFKADILKVGEEPAGRSGRSGRSLQYRSRGGKEEEERKKKGAVARWRRRARQRKKRSGGAGQGS